MICTWCHRIMTCVKTGQKLRFGEGHCYAGDVYACKKCDNSAAIITGGSFHDMTSPAIQMEDEVANG